MGESANEFGDLLQSFICQFLVASEKILNGLGWFFFFFAIELEYSPAKVFCHKIIESTLEGKGICSFSVEDVHLLANK